MKCSRCWKPTLLCLCDAIRPAPAPLRLLILQHPQEARNPNSTSRLLSLSIDNSVHRVGLSWRSLGAALGEEASPKDWAVLYAGQAKEAQALATDQTVHLLSPGKKLRDLRGVILLDGNWKQAKTLWWRNAWLTRLTRIVLTPPNTSLFNSVGRQPRKHCVCTLEAALEILRAFGNAQEAEASLDHVFQAFMGSPSALSPTQDPL